MQIDDVQLEMTLLDLFLSRHDYKDNHDAIINNYFPRAAKIAGKLNRPGFHGGRLVEVNLLSRSSRRDADSSLPQPRPVEYTQWAPAVGGD